MPAGTGQQQLRAFLAKYDPGIAATAKRALTKMRALLPGATELVYDNYNALVIGFGTTERASDAVLSIGLDPRWVTLFFLDGRSLADPKKLLNGSGARVRQSAASHDHQIDFEKQRPRREGVGPPTSAARDERTPPKSAARHKRK